MSEVVPRVTKRKTRPISLVELTPEPSTSKSAKDQEQKIPEEDDEEEEIDDGLEPDETVLYAMSSNAVLHHNAFKEFAAKETQNTFDVNLNKTFQLIE